MANYVDTLIGHEVEIRIGDGGSPETFGNSALMTTSKSVDFSVSTSDTSIPDLDNLGGLAQMHRESESTDLSITGNGIVHKASVSEYLDWAQSGEAKNVQVRLAGKVMSGRFIMTQFKIGGERKAATEAEITIVQAGAIAVDDA